MWTLNFFTFLQNFQYAMNICVMSCHVMDIFIFLFSQTILCKVFVDIGPCFGSCISFLHGAMMLYLNRPWIYVEIIPVINKFHSDFLNLRFVVKFRAFTNRFKNLDMFLLLFNANTVIIKCDNLKTTSLLQKKIVKYRWNDDRIKRVVEKFNYKKKLLFVSKESIYTANQRKTSCVNLASPLRQRELCLRFSRCYDATVASNYMEIMSSASAATCCQFLQK